jgi:hypothetical protein
VVHNLQLLQAGRQQVAHLCEHDVVYTEIHLIFSFFRLVDSKSHTCLCTTSFIQKKKTTLGWVVNGGRRHAERKVGGVDAPRLWC